MKKITTTIALFITVTAFTQGVVSETLYKISNSYYGFWSGKSESVEVALNMIYKFPYADTSLSCTVRVANSKTYLNSSFLIGNSSYIHFSPTYTQSDSSITFNYQMFDTLLTYGRTIEKLSMKGSMSEKIILFRVQNFSIAYQHTAKSDDYYFISLGNNSFRMGHSEYASWLKSLEVISTTWEGFRKDKIIMYQTQPKIPD